MKILVTILLSFLSLALYSQEEEIRTDVVSVFKSQLHVRELTGNNDGKDVQKYLKETNLQGNYPWCAAFTTWGFNMCNIPNPKSAWSPHWAKEKDRIWSKGMPVSLLRKRLQKGDVFTIYFNSIKRVGHVGVFVKWAPNGNLITIEGNTNVAGSRLGIGVFERERPIYQIYAITNYITPYLK